MNHHKYTLQRSIHYSKSGLPDVAATLSQSGIKKSSECHNSSQTHSHVVCFLLLASTMVSIDADLKVIRTPSFEKQQQVAAARARARSQSRSRTRASSSTRRGGRRPGSEDESYPEDQKNRKSRTEKFRRRKSHHAHASSETNNGDSQERRRRGRSKAPKKNRRSSTSMEESYAHVEVVEPTSNGHHDDHRHARKQERRSRRASTGGGNGLVDHTDHDYKKSRKKRDKKSRRHKHSDRRTSMSHYDSDSSPEQEQNGMLDEYKNNLPFDQIRSDDDSEEDYQSVSGDSMTSEDSFVPTKKPINISPHTAEELSEAQRKDKVLRRFITETKSTEISARRVDGILLVFYDKKVYVPRSLRDSTIGYYLKKHPRHTDFFIAKNFYWPYMEDDVKEATSRKWEVKVVTKSPTSRRGSM